MSPTSFAVGMSISAASVLALLAVIFLLVVYLSDLSSRLDKLHSELHNKDYSPEHEPLGLVDRVSDCEARLKNLRCSIDRAEKAHDQLAGQTTREVARIDEHLKAAIAKADLHAATIRALLRSHASLSGEQSRHRGRLPHLGRRRGEPSFPGHPGVAGEFRKDAVACAQEKYGYSFLRDMIAFPLYQSNPGIFIKPEWDKGKR